MTDDDFAATPKMRIKKKTVGFFFTHAPRWLRRSLWVYAA